MSKKDLEKEAESMANEVMEISSHLIVANNENVDKSSHPVPLMMGYLLFVSRTAESFLYALKETTEMKDILGSDKMYVIFKNIFEQLVKIKELIPFIETKPTDTTIH